MRKFVYILPFVLSACGAARGGVQGGVLVPYAKLDGRPDRTYSTSSCRQRGGEAARVPEGVEYEIRTTESKGRRRPPALIEHTLNESEARLFLNSWSEGSARHYFVWLPEARGFEYVIPEDALAPAERRIYNRPQVQRVRGAEGSAMRPMAPPDIVCQMTLN